MLSRKTYQNQGICCVTEMFVARNANKVGQACSRPKYFAEVFIGN